MSSRSSSTAAVFAAEQRRRRATKAVVATVILGKVVEVAFPRCRGTQLPESRVIVCD